MMTWDRLAISPPEARLIRDAHAAFLDADPASEATLAAVRETALHAFPDRLLTALQAISRQEATHVALLVQGLVAQPDLPPTPAQASVLPGSRLTLPSEIVALGAALVLGEPVAYRAEKHGALVQHVFPVRSEARAPSNESSATMLDLHTELVFSRRAPQRPLHADSPDLILLGCLRSDPDQAAATLIAAVEDLCARTPSSDLSVLRQPRFELRAPYSFTRDRPEDRPWVGPVPILGPSATPLTAAFDLACGARGIDTEAERALDALRAAAASPGALAALRLQAGDLLVLDNRRCAHGRTPFAAAYDGRDRWLLRLYVRRSLHGMEPIDRALSPRIF